MSKFHESKVTFLASSTPRGRGCRVTPCDSASLGHYRKPQSISIQKTKWSSGAQPHSYIYSTMPALKAQITTWKGGGGRAERLWEPEDQEIPCEIVFWKCQKSYTHEGSAAWLPKPDLNKYNTNRQANIEDGNLMEATHIQRHRWSSTKKAWEWEKYFSSGMSPVVGYPIPSDQLWNNTHTNNTRQTEQVVFMFLDICAGLCMHTSVYTPQ